MTEKNKELFVRHFERVQRECFEIATSKGWHDTPRTHGEYFALFHSEISEGFEGIRHRNPASDKIPKFTAVEEELADTIIRICDYAEAMGFDVANAMLAKIEYNKSRSYRHGNKAV
jgi:NTP pyrophosphatase (non-canonical NTP hydrolase)